MLVGHDDLYGASFIPQCRDRRSARRVIRRDILLTDQNGEESSWYLGSTPSSPPLAGQWALHRREVISDDEYASHQASAGLISETVINSSYAELQRRCNKFHDTLLEVGNAFSTGRASPQMAQSIASDLDDALTSLRRFADRTAHALSQRYGDICVHRSGYSRSPAFYG